MTLQETLSHHLRHSRESMRALSLRAGLGEKAVADILAGKSRRPAVEVLAALSDAIGQDLVAIPLAPQGTYSDLLAQLEADPPKEWSRDRRADVTGKIRWLIKKQGWDPRTRIVSRREVVDLLEKATGAELGLSVGSKATYKSLILAGLDAYKPRGRKRDISDVPGSGRDLYRAAKDKALGFPADMIFAAGPFLLYACDQGIPLGQITTETLRLYFEYRMASGTKTETKEKKHTKRVAAFLTRVASEPALTRFGVRPVAHPFADGRDKYQVPDHLLASVLKEFDEKVAPWTRGEMSRDGLTRAELVARLDAEEPELSGKEALLQRFVGKDPKSRREARDKAFREAGFLPRDQTWQNSTAATRRGFVIAFCKALHAGAGYLVESIDEMVRPAVVEAGAAALYEANLGTFESGYVASVLKTIKKIARDFCCCRPEDLEKIDIQIADYETDQDGISERNKTKMQGFTATRLDDFIDLGSRMIAGVNARAELNRRRIEREKKRPATLAETYDSEMVRDVMAALAHEILLRRAPRSENVLGIRLDYIRWLDGEATIVIPSEEVKMREKDDPDLVIPLSPYVSGILRAYIDKIRPLALPARSEGDAAHAEENPYLFPYQGDGKAAAAGTQPYAGLLDRVVRAVHEHVGVRINPHLYRHLLGWIWLREDVSKLAAVSKLLGHRSVETTVKYYAEIDETLALQAWNDFLEKKREQSAARKAGEGPRRFRK
jgi:integrase/transcriptional regulator with XRE-family HTH domain